MGQTSMTYLAPSAFEGMLGDIIPRVIRGAIERWVSDVDIPFGRAVTMLPNGKISPITAAGQNVLGIAVAVDMFGMIPTVLSGVPQKAPGYPPLTPLNILTVGDIWVWTEDAVTAGSPMLVRAVAAAAPKDILGRFAKTAGTGLEAPTGAEIAAITATKGAGLVAVRVNTK